MTRTNTRDSRQRRRDRDRRSARPRRAPGPPAIPGEHQPERAAARTARRCAPGSPGRRAARPGRTTGRSPAGRGRPSTGRPRRAAGRAKSCRAGPCRRSTAAGSRPGSRRRPPRTRARRRRGRSPRSAARPSAPISANGSADAQARRPNSGKERHLDDATPAASSGRSTGSAGPGSAGMAAADLGEDPDEVDVEALAGVQRPGDIDVVERIRVRRVRKVPDQDQPGRRGRARTTGGGYARPVQRSTGSGRAPTGTNGPVRGPDQGCMMALCPSPSAPGACAGY